MWYTIVTINEETAITDRLWEVMVTWYSAGLSIEETVVQSHHFKNYAISFTLLSGVYARGSKRSHTGGKCVTFFAIITVIPAE